MREKTRQQVLAMARAGYIHPDFVLGNGKKWPSNKRREWEVALKCRTLKASFEFAQRWPQYPHLHD